MQYKKNYSLLRFVAQLLFSGIIIGALSGCTTFSSITPEQKAISIVNKSTSVFLDFWSSDEKPMQQMRDLYPDAKGIVILPGVLKGSFIVGAEGGSGILLARDASGRWGYPAFYTMAAGSIGFQAGGQSSDIVLLLFSDKAVRALVRHQGKIGADLGLTVGTVSTGVEASTTTNVGADILSFSSGIGIFAGASAEAAIMIKRNDFNYAYYEGEVTPEQIVIDGAVQNPHADKLRNLLSKQ